MEKKLPGFLQSIVDIPLALKGFPKNLFKEPSEDKEELDLYLREMSAYTWFGVLLVILGFVLNINGVGMLVALAGFMFIILVLYRKNHAKNADLVEQIKEEAHSNPAKYAAANEVRKAEKRYRDAVYKYERFKDSHLKTYYEIEKDKAYAALLAAQSKSANNK